MFQNQIRSDQDTLVIRSRSFAGTDCGAFINAQANLLERQQARIDNPESTDEDLWVVCPLSMPLGVGGDPESCDDPPAWSRIGGSINVFWNNGATIDGRVDCVVRHYGYHNTHQPGVSLDGVLSVATLSSHFDETQSLPYVDSLEPSSCRSRSADGAM